MKVYDSINHLSDQEIWAMIKKGGVPISLPMSRKWLLLLGFADRNNYIIAYSSYMVN